MKKGDKVRVISQNKTYKIEAIRGPLIFLEGLDDLFFYEEELEKYRPELDQMI